MALYLSTPQHPRTPQHRRTAKHLSTPQHPRMALHLSTPQHPRTALHRRMAEHPRTPRHSSTPEHRRTAHCGTRPSKNAYPMSTTKFQRKVFSMLFDLKDQLQKVSGILDPGRSTATIKKMESESDLKIFEDKIQDVDNRLICVQQLSRIGGSTIRDCVNKVMNRYFS
ncbi:uncharacterized protein LOC131541341 isoform X2 [Onychostoma macrolepis]|uniref:uncharacterized protein LOC131541341 isoform X2 n=1 Tax=Onychostoma macrolepis TaxID=369639 RepID=UPI00272A1B21|nr:uncharacterized protein LOC131541341 isoform X2 [Onychostoma macrolepis]